MQKTFNRIEDVRHRKTFLDVFGLFVTSVLCFKKKGNKKLLAFDEKTLKKTVSN